MIKFKRKLQWFWDLHVVSMKPGEYFHYMEKKYGQQWYDFVDRSFEQKFGI
jgi:hypothetical protein